MSIGTASLAEVWASRVVDAHSLALQAGDVDPALSDGLFYDEPAGGEAVLSLLGLKLVAANRNGHSAVFIDRMTPEEYLA